MPSASTRASRACASRALWRPSTLALWVLGAAAAGACGPRVDASTPRGAVDAYSAALAQERYVDAYSLLSAETRGNLTFRAFTALLAEHPEEVRALLVSLRSGGPRATVRATVTGKDGQTLELAYESGGWKIEESAISLYPQSTPRAAIGSFVRAYDAKRWDVLLRFVPEADLAGLDEKLLQSAWEGEEKASMTRVLGGLRASLSQPQIEEVGDRATLAYVGGGTATLVLERGTWKIEDFK